MNKAEQEDSIDSLLSALNNFKCALDEDIEDFLHSKAIDFLKRGWCSVYLVLNAQEFKNNRLKIEAYFTLSHKTLLVTDDISKSKVQKYGGFKNLQSLQFVLIGQLGKYISIKDDATQIKSDVTSNELLDMAFEVIYAASDFIPCRCVLVECKDVEKVKQVYINYDFEFFQEDNDYFQYVKLLEH